MPPQPPPPRPEDSSGSDSSSDSDSSSSSSGSDSDETSTTTTTTTTTTNTTAPGGNNNGAAPKPPASESSSSGSSSSGSGTTTTTTTTTTATGSNAAAPPAAASQRSYNQFPQPPAGGPKKVSFVPPQQQPPQQPNAALYNQHPSSQPTPVYYSGSGQQMQPGGGGFYPPPQQQQQQVQQQHQQGRRPSQQQEGESSSDDESTTNSETTTSTSTTTTTTTTTSGKTGSSTSGTTTTTTNSSSTTSGSGTQSRGSADVAGVQPPPAANAGPPAPPVRKPSATAAKPRAQQSSTASSSSSSGSSSSSDSSDDESTTTGTTVSSSTHSSPVKRPSKPKIVTATTTGVAEQAVAPPPLVKRSADSAVSSSTSSASTETPPRPKKKSSHREEAAPTAAEVRTRGLPLESAAVGKAAGDQTAASIAQKVSDTNAKNKPPVIAADAAAAPSTPSASSIDGSSGATSQQGGATGTTGSSTAAPPATAAAAVDSSKKPSESGSTTTQSAAAATEPKKPKPQKTSDAPPVAPADTTANPEEAAARRQPTQPQPQPQPTSAHDGRYSSTGDHESTDETYTDAVSSDDDDAIDDGAAAIAARLKPRADAAVVVPAGPELVEQRERVEIAALPETPATQPLPEAFVTPRNGLEDVAYAMTATVHSEVAVPLVRSEYAMLLGAFGVSDAQALAMLGDRDEFPFESVVSRVEEEAVKVARQALLAAFEARESCASEVSIAACTEVIAHTGVANANLDNRVTIALRVRDGGVLHVEIAGEGLQHPVLVNLAGGLQLSMTRTDVICGTRTVCTIPELRDRVIVSLQIAGYVAELVALSVVDRDAVDYVALVDSLFAPPTQVADAGANRMRRSLIHQRAIMAICRPVERLQYLRYVAANAATTRPTPYLAGDVSDQPRRALFVPTLSADGISFARMEDDPPSDGNKKEVAQLAADEAFIIIDLDAVVIPGEDIPDGARRFVLISAIDSRGGTLPPIRVDAVDPAKAAERDAPWVLTQKGKPKASVALLGATTDIIYFEVGYELRREQVPEAQRAIYADGEPPAGDAAMQSFCLAFATLPISSAEKGSASLWLSGGTFHNKRPIKQPETTSSCFCLAGPPASRIEVSISRDLPATVARKTLPRRLACHTRHLELLSAFRCGVAYVADSAYGGNSHRALLDIRVDSGLRLVDQAESLELFSSYWAELIKKYSDDQRKDRRFISHNVVTIAREVYCTWCITGIAEKSLKVLRGEDKIAAWDNELIVPPIAAL